MLLSYAGTEACDCGEIEFADEALLIGLRAVQGLEKGEARVAGCPSEDLGKWKRRREDADDFVRDAIKRYRFPDGGRIALKAVAPECVSEDEDVATAGVVLLGAKGSAEGRMGSEH